MKQYKLREDEVCLCETGAYEEITGKYYDIMLTNINLVLLHTKQRLFKPSEYTVTTYLISDIKFYNNEPYIKLSKKIIEVYFKTCEFKFNFENSENSGDVNKLYNEFIKLLTGKSLAERNSEKFKGAVKIVDDTLGIDTLGTAKSVVENGVGGTILGGTKNSNANENRPKGKLGLFANVIGAAKEILSGKSEDKVDVNKNQSMEDKIETIKKLKELLDMGIITQEEYELKKKQIFEL